MATDTLEEAVIQSLRMGPLGAALRQAEASDELKREVETALRGALEPRLVDGRVRLPAAAWIVSARNP